MGKNSIFFGLIILVLAFLYSGCEDASTIGFPVSEPKVQTIFVDTFSLKTSTVLLDSIATSATGRILVGEYHDAAFGKTSSSSYFQMGSNNASSFAPVANAVFDSMVLILRYDNYFYGDTTKTQQLAISELTEEITPRYTFDRDKQFSHLFYVGSSVGALFNHSKTKSAATPLATFTYKPNPVSADSIYIRMPDQKGLEFFTLAKGEDKAQLVGSNFLQIFKGIKIAPAAPVSSAVIGFASATVKMRLYYSEPDVNGTLKQKFFDFDLYNAGLEYNQTTSDRTGSALQNLSPQIALSSDATNNETYIKGGAGVLTKIEFPNFDFLNSKGQKFLVLSARLIVTPVLPVGTKLPAQLGLFEVNNINIPIQPLANDFQNTAQVAALDQDKELGRRTQYSFLVTNYIDAKLNKQSIFTSSLLLGLPALTLQNSTDALQIGNGKNQKSKIKLEIYLSRLNN